MATHSQPAEILSGEEPAPAARLTDVLDAKLAELRAQGFRIVRIECSADDLTRLIVEGGDMAVQLDADPAVDRAWYKGFEISHAVDREMTWVFLTGEAADGEQSAHIVSASDAD